MNPLDRCERCPEWAKYCLHVRDRFVVAVTMQALYDETARRFGGEMPEHCDVCGSPVADNFREARARTAEYPMSEVLVLMPPAIDVTEPDCLCSVGLIVDEADAGIEPHLMHDCGHVEHIGVSMLRLLTTGHTRRDDESREEEASA